MTVILFILGLGALILGAELLVRGSTNLASAIRISPLIIGLTIVAFGTSSPELAVSVQSALSGNVDISLGNVVGSNIFNVLFILGISTIITPLAVSQRLVRLEVPIMIIVSVMLFLFGLDGKIGKLDGTVLFVFILIYIYWTISRSRNIKEQIVKKHKFVNCENKNPTKLFSYIVLIISGLALLIIGSCWLVDGAVRIAQRIGISELIIGLTIVAAGTSLPEAATSIIASIRGERDIAVSNIIGSNIFNILAVLGLSGLVVPDGIQVEPVALKFDIPVMVVTAVVCLPVFFTGSMISRWEGFLFTSYYAFYTIYLILASSHHNALPHISFAMKIFVIPLTIIMLLISVIRTVRSR